MNNQRKSLLHQVKLLGLSIGLGAVLLACASTQDNKPIRIDGSSTVYPITQAVADAYKAQNKDTVEIEAAQKNPALIDFVEYYIKQAPEIVPTVGYIPLPREGYHLASVIFQNGEAGTVFEGRSQIGLTIGELLRKKAKF